MCCVLLMFLGFVLLSWTDVPRAVAGEARPAPVKAKQEAESKGYFFVASHEEIVAGAKREGP